VLVAHGADFEQSMRTKQAERRLALEERAERVMVDALIARVPHVIVISSAMVNGASLGREIIADDTPPRDLTDGFVGDIIHCEQILQRAVLNITQGAGETKFTVLRMAAVVAPGVDLSVFSPRAPGGKSRNQERAERGLHPEQEVIVFAGRLQPLKSPDVLVEMIGKIADRAREAQKQGLAAVKIPTLIILGGPSGRPLALEELKVLAKLLEIDAYVRFEPPVGRAELAAWFRIADIVAVPSRNESFGLVAIEAQACGTPVVAAAVGGLRSAVADGISGVLVPSHEPARWADIMVDLFNHPDRIAALGAGATTQAASFTWENTAKATLEVYRSAARISR